MENCPGGNGSYGIGSNQICNILYMTINHVSSYNALIDGVDFRYKGKVVDDASLTFDVDESANDVGKLMLLVDNGNIIPHGELVEHFKSFTEFDGDETEPKEVETEPLKP